VIRGKGEHLALDTKESIIYNDCPHKIVATIGVSNLVIVNTEDAVLVIDKSRHQEVKNLVGKIKENSTWGRYL
jgi:mannose-1-phosphate guanylyltransferase